MAASQLGDDMTQIITKKTKLAYGMGQFAWAAKDTCFHYFLFFYYTQMLGLTPALAGFAALLSIIADALSDPIIGHLSDRYKVGKWGRRHPFMILSVLPTCFSLVAIFNPPAGLSQMELFSWYLIFAIIVRTFLTYFVVPHMSLSAEMSDNYAERTSIVVYRTFLGYCGGLSLQVVAWFLLIPIATAAGHAIDGYRNVGYVAAMMAFVGMVVSILGTKNRIPHLTKASSAQQSRPWYCAFSDIGQLFKLRSARIIIVANLILISALGVSNTMLLHINSFFYGFSSEQTGAFMMCIFLALIPASLLAVQGTKRLGKPRSMVVFLTLTAVLGPIPIVAHMYGLTSGNGTAGLLLLVCGVLVLHQSFFIAHLNIAGSVVAEVVDEMELKNGFRQEGILNSALMLIQKMTFGVGTFLAGLTLDFAGIKGVTEIESVTSDMLLRLGWIYGPGLAVMVFLSAVIFSRLKLSQADYATIQQQLQHQRAATAGNPEVV